MDARKFIHVLLIAVLCYGQLIASTHVVSHFHDHTCDSATSLDFHGCIDAQHGNELERQLHAARYHKVPTAKHHSSFTHVEGDKSSAHADCSIYHTYLGLSGVFCAGSAEIRNSLKHAIKSTFTTVQLARAAVNDQHIRAPPTLS